MELIYSLKICAKNGRVFILINFICNLKFGDGENYLLKISSKT